MAMERRALVVALALTLPLALYGIPYAYAATVSSTYVVRNVITVPPSTLVFGLASCHSGDYATGGEANWFSAVEGGPAANDLPISSGQPTQWFGSNINVDPSNTRLLPIYVVCQTPITVAGVGVPEFGSLYVAIALGAVAYFMLSRRFARRPTTSTLA